MAQSLQFLFYTDRSSSEKGRPLAFIVAGTKIATSRSYLKSEWSDHVRDAAAPSSRLRSAGGFTLVELVIAVALVGILAGIAYPSYVNQTIRANRSAAQQFMLDIANAQAQYQIDARSYTATIGTGGLGLAPTSAASSNYTFAIILNAGPPPGYLITATPTGRQALDGALTLDSRGSKTPASKW